MTTLAVVGLGLIGGSIAKACVEQKLFAQVIGVDKSAQTGKFALNNKIVHKFSVDLSIVEQADLIIIATPVLAFFSIFKHLAQLKLKANAIISDAGSVKQSVIEAAQILAAKFTNFVPAHPIAGSEQSGITAAISSLFLNHQVIITPTAQTNANACEQVSNLWRKLGAKVTFMEAKKHDQILAATSHLPHLLAFALVDSLAKNDQSLAIFNYAAGGFRDFTRIAGSDPQMWRDIFISNKNEVLSNLDTFMTDLTKLKQALIAQDSDFILASLRNAQGARSYFAQILAQRNKE